MYDEQIYFIADMYVYILLQLRTLKERRFAVKPIRFYSENSKMAGWQILQYCLRVRNRIFLTLKQIRCRWYMHSNWQMDS